MYKYEIYMYILYKYETGVSRRLANVALSKENYILTVALHLVQHLLSTPDLFIG